MNEHTVRKSPMFVYSSKGLKSGFVFVHPMLHAVTIKEFIDLPAYRLKDYLADIQQSVVVNFGIFCLRFSVYLIIVFSSLLPCEY